MACNDAWEPLTPHESRPDRGFRLSWRQVLLLPFRVLLTIGVFIGAFVISKLYLLCPTARTKRLYAWIARLQSQFLLEWCYGFRLRVEGLENLATPCIVVANHTSVYDVWALMAAIGPLAFVARASLFRLPVLGTILRALDAIGVDRRQGGAAARQAIADRVDSRSFAPCVFAEGATTNGVGLLEFKSGAFSPGADIQPIVLTFECPSKFDLSYTSNQMSTTAVATHFFRTLLEPDKVATVRIFPLVKATSAQREDATVYARHVRALMAEALPKRKRWDGWDTKRMRQVWYGKESSHVD